MVGGGGVLLGGPDGDVVVGDLLQQQQVVHSSTSFMDCFKDIDRGLSGGKDVIYPTIVLKTLQGVLVVGGVSLGTRVGRVKSCLAAGLSVQRGGWGQGASVSGVESGIPISCS